MRNPLGELVKSHLENDAVFGKIYGELTGEVSEGVDGETIRIIELVMECFISGKVVYP